MPRTKSPEFHPMPGHRNPFARTTLERMEFQPSPGTTCHECGSTNGRGNLYKFRTSPDAGRDAEHRGLFCSLSCHNAYHGA